MLRVSFCEMEIGVALVSMDVRQALKSASVSLSSLSFSHLIDLLLVIGPFIPSLSELIYKIKFGLYTFPWVILSGLDCLTGSLFHDL
jgi:hypothetical protein